MSCIHKISILLLLFFIPTKNSFGQNNPANSIIAKSARRTTGASSIRVNDSYFVATTTDHSSNGPSILNIYKYNANLDTVWYRNITTPYIEYTVNCIKMTSNGYLLVTGISDYKTIVGMDRSFLAKFDTLGNFLWMRHYGADEPYFLSTMFDLIELPDGNYALGGSEIQSASALDPGGPVVYKVDTSGQIIWKYVTYNSGLHINKFIYRSIDSSFYAACTDYLGNDQACLVKINSLGSAVWFKYFAAENGNDVLSDSTGLLFLTNRKLYKTNYNGDSVWVKSYDVDNSINYDGFYAAFNGYFSSLTKTKDGGFLLGGSAQVPYYTGDRPSPLSKSYNYKLIKTDASGNQIWNKNFGNGRQDDYLKNILFLNDSVVVLSGLTQPRPYGVWLFHLSLNGNPLSCPRYLNPDEYSPIKDCKGDSFFLRLQYDSGYALAHKWIKDGTPLLNESNRGLTTPIPGNYWIYLTDSANGCKDSVQQIAYNTLPPANFTAGDDVNRCINQNQTIEFKPIPKTGTYSGKNVSNISFTVQPSSLGYGVFPYVYQVYHEGCDFRDTLVVTIDSVLPPKAIISSNIVQPMCNGDTVTLHIDSNYFGAVWLGKSIDKAVQNFCRYKDSSLAYVAYSYANYACRDTASYRISFKPKNAPATLVLNGSNSICLGDTVQLSTTQNYAQYLWSTGDTTPFIYVNTTGSYSVKVNSLGTCLSNSAIPKFITVNPLSAQPNINVVTTDTIESSLVGDVYEWFRNDVRLTANGRKLALDSAGKYEVRIKENGFDCFSQKSLPYFWTPVGVPNLLFQDITLFPNPVDNYLTLQGLAHANQSVSIAIYNLVGQQLILQKQLAEPMIEIPVHSLPVGIYCLLLKINNQVLTKTFYKK